MAKNRLLILIIFSSLLTCYTTTASAQLTVEGSQLIEEFQAGAQTGSAIAVGDFDNDGREDLVFGSPSSRIDGEPVGRIRMFVGSDSGLEHIISYNAGNLPGGDNQSGARFGASLAAGDFDGDGRDDLAIGIPGRLLLARDNAGAVAVIYAKDSFFLSASSTVFFDQGSLGSFIEAGDQFGSRLAAGDLDGDGVDDLAIASIGEDSGKGDSIVDMGIVHVMYGVMDTGLVTAGSTTLSRLDPDIDLEGDDNDEFGAGLAIGQFTSDNIADLAVGIPGDGQYSNAADGHGSVYVFFGSPAGLDLDANEQTWSQERAGVLGQIGADDGFGATLVTADFDGDGEDDLAIGVPGEDELGANQSGAVQVLYGIEDFGLSQVDDQFLVEAVFDTDVDPFDRFGEALAAGDFDGDGHDDLAIGAPLDNSLDVTNAGEVSILYGTPTGLSSAGAQLANMIFFGGLSIGDEFGFALATGRFRGESADSLAIGVPNYQTGGKVQAGAVAVLFTQVLFNDGFESGDIASWSSSVGF